jgi:hypothetical protein
MSRVRRSVLIACARAHPISRRHPRGAAAVAWQSTTSTSSSESGSVHNTVGDVRRSNRLPSRGTAMRSSVAYSPYLRPACVSPEGSAGAQKKGDGCAGIGVRRARPVSTATAESSNANGDPRGAKPARARTFINDCLWRGKDRSRARPGSRGSQSRATSRSRLRCFRWPNGSRSRSLRSSRPPGRSLFRSRPW